MVGNGTTSANRARSKRETVLVIRADASSAIGIGHVMRCLALAQAWQDAGGRAVFVMAETTTSAEKRLREESCDVIRISVQPGSTEDGRETIRIARAQKADWVAVDGYQFDSEYQRDLKAAGFKLLFVDDYGHARRYCADVVLNQNVSADEKLYQSREPQTRLLLGTSYCLLRREFEAWRDWKREIPQVGRRVLVTMGGSDTDNITTLALESLTKVKTAGLRATVVAGGDNPHFGSAEEMQTRGRIRLRQSVAKISELMAEADLAVIAAGGTLWELLYMSCPVLSFARNTGQRRVLENLQRQEIVRYLGDPKGLGAARLASEIDGLAGSAERRKTMAAQGRKQIDGEGARRVCQVLTGLN